ncbi:MAG: branched-chain amino acid ABC transporter permease [Acidimicrobiia bacterium]|nr:branched-chain amino acid ABC transporter permease [Acidimicrobiia bacterium]
MQLFLQRLFDGLDNGAVYAVVAVALVLIFKATTLVNFAQGELAMFGTFIAYILAVEPDDAALSYTLGWASWEVGFLPFGLLAAIFVAMAISAATGAAIERVLIRPFDPTDHLPVVLITLGLFLILNSVAGYLWNFNPRPFPSMFASGTDDFVSIGGARLRHTVIGTWAVMGLMLLALWFILTKTKAGLAFRAVSSNTESARLVGVRVGRTLMFGWALAAAFGTLGGSLVAPKLFLQPNMMATLLIFSFAAATVGGLDSLIGAVVGGITIGLIQSILVGYLGDYDPAFIILSLAVAFLCILTVLWFKPSGLFGTARVERV